MEYGRMGMVIMLYIGWNWVELSMVLLIMDYGDLDWGIDMAELGRRRAIGRRV